MGKLKNLLIDTAEDEEFNRIEMESRIKQEYVRDIKLPTREQLIAEVTVLTELVRVLSDRVTELEKQEPVAWNLKDVTDAYKLGAKSQQRTWVGLMRGVRVEGDTVIISVHYGNDAARQVCGELINEMETRKEKNT